MRAPVPTTEISEFINRHFVDICQTMLSITATSISPVVFPLHADRVSGSVGFEGENVVGSIYLHLSPHLAARAATAMLGLPPEESPSGEAEINDVVSELTNMAGGGFKSWLCDTGVSCAMSPPAIIRGGAFDIETTPGAERICLSFDCENEPVLFEVHIKFN